MFKKIMFPTDFSKASNMIYNCIPSFKRLGMEDAILVHIVDDREKDNIIERTTWAEDELEKFIDLELKDDSITAKPVVRLGVPFFDLNEVALEEDVSLVVITSHGKSMIEKMLLGSVTEKFIYHSQKPVLIEKVGIFENCKPKECCDVICENTFKHILFPTDWSTCASDVLENIKKFKDIGTESVTAQHVMDVRHLKYHTDKKIKELEQIDLDKLEVVKGELEKCGFKAQTILTAGHPFNEIKRAAREPEITLIAMGVHGKGFVKESILGSTAERVARHAFKPVLLLNHSKV